MTPNQFKGLIEDELHAMNIKAEVLSETCISDKGPLLWAAVVRIVDDAAAIAINARQFQDDQSIKNEIKRQLKDSDLF